MNDNTIKLNTGLIVKFLGIILKFFDSKIINENTVNAYVYLKNKIFVNAYLIKSGLAAPDFSVNHKYKDKFIQLWKERQNG